MRRCPNLINLDSRTRLSGLVHISDPDTSHVIRTVEHRASENSCLSKDTQLDSTYVS